MNIKNIKYYLLGLGIGCGFVATTVSCSDYLDLKPLNDVVLENYWTKKSDVTSVLMGCYESLYSEDCVTRMGLWGEARSDNMVIGVSTSQELEQLVKEDILPSNSYCNWASFYQTINRCNIVIHYAPQVQELDPNYTLTEMKANVAEATFIRSLCYFYLIRTFRDVPFTREPSIDDTTARVTKPAVYALLADLYLWQGNWDKCVECCNYVIDFKQNEFENLKRRLQNDVYLFNDIPLLMEQVNNTSGNAYNAIFGEGNSFESLFELTFDQTLNTDNRNGFVGNFYANTSGNQLSNGRLAPFDEFYGDLPLKSTDLFNAGDCRAYESIYQAGTSQYYIAKYAATRVSINSSASQSSWKPTYSWRSTNYAHWIIYRLTDVMLMKAEALIEQGNNNFEDAFALINAVSKRSVNSFAPGSGEVLKYADYKDSKEDMEKLVMDERHRELLFEGKRWYDLLRVARRTGNTKDLATTVTKKQLTNVSGIQIKLANPNALYLPYYRNELKVNPYLKQNPAYNTGDDADLEKN